MGVCIYPVPAAQLARRIAPRAQRLALAPFPRPREHAAPWGLNRKPLDFRELTDLGWTELELPRDKLPLPGAPPPPRAPALQLPPLGPRTGGRVLPERMAGTIWVDRTLAGAKFASNSWGPIPWPFQICGLQIMVENDTTTVGHLGLYINDGHTEGNFTLPPGQPLYDTIFGPNSDFTLANGGPTYLHFSTSASVAGIVQQVPANSYTGRSVYDSGKHITLVVRDNAAGTSRYGVNITVERLAPLELEERFSARPVPRVAAPAPAPRPASSPPRPAGQPRPIQLHAATFAGPIWGPGAGNPTPWAGWGSAR